MIHSNSSFAISSSPCLNIPHTSNKTTSTAQKTRVNKFKMLPHSDSLGFELDESKKKMKMVATELPRGRRFCLCGRRGFIGGSTLLPIVYPSRALDLHPPTDPKGMLNRIHPPRPDWYEEFYASAMNTNMESYEAEIAGYKSQVFANLSSKANKILELGIGTGPNLKYYAGNSDVDVVGVDPNRKMEKYAQAAALSNGISLNKFKFIQAVGEALPIDDASIDAVVGTLVLCSVKDVDTTLQEVRRVLKPGGLYLFLEHVAAKEGTILKFVQDVLDPLQQTVADGCHLTRNTGTSISAAGFSSVDVKMAYLPNLSLISPHVFGIARR